jgi:hypothetical protein
LADLMRSLHLLKAKSQQGFLFDSWPILRRWRLRPFFRGPSGPLFFTHSIF